MKSTQQKSGLLLALFALTIFFSCKKNNDDAGNNIRGKKIKYTITVTGLENTDHAGFSLSNVDEANDELTWKVNGVIKKYNTGVLALNEVDFLGTTKTYVIESVGPVIRSAIIGNCVDAASGSAPFNVSLKVEIDGKAVREDNATVTVPNPYNCDYVYEQELK